MVQARQILLFVALCVSTVVAAPVPAIENVYDRDTTATFDLEARTVDVNREHIIHSRHDDSSSQFSRRAPANLQTYAEFKKSMLSGTEVMPTQQMEAMITSWANDVIAQLKPKDFAVAFGRRYESYTVDELVLYLNTFPQGMGIFSKDALRDLSLDLLNKAAHKAQLHDFFRRAVRTASDNYKEDHQTNAQPRIHTSIF